MREIKFRGKQLHGDQWLIGDLSHVGEEKYTFIYPTIKGGEELNSPDYYQVKPETVGQFTGVLDGAKREIYEGDFLSTISLNNPVNYQVKFENGSFCLFGKFGRWGTIDKIEEVCKRLKISVLEIIGNVTDNPELLQ